MGEMIVISGCMMMGCCLLIDCYRLSCRVSRGINSMITVDGVSWLDVVVVMIQWVYSMGTFWQVVSGISCCPSSG